MWFEANVSGFVAVLTSAFLNSSAMSSNAISDLSVLLQLAMRP